ncbi:hypothetical protein GCM10027598_58630 [Amycolatopsis oliviviridis]|uniref:DUF6879 domain-containing protein n=2 Tax=Amycolatopsis oliviviridis TaxID=1471590 RepID=A0ABQ3LZ74_9PSEU|nr:hypothetical protein GCM10017790_59280 [Amycolatopsis oliviviridis]
MRPVDMIHEPDVVQETATGYMDLMAFKRTSFRFQSCQRYRVGGVEKAAFETFKQTGVYELAQDDPRLLRQRTQLSGGRVLQRVQLVVPPLSDYLRFAFVYFDHFARAGEDLRILDVSKMDSDGLPNHDFVLLDDEIVIKFRHSSEDGSVIGRELMTNADLARFRGYRDRALELAVPFGEYQERG